MVINYLLNGMILQASLKDRLSFYRRPTRSILSLRSTNMAMENP